MTKRNILLRHISVLAVLYGVGMGAVHADPVLPKPLKAVTPGKAVSDLTFTDAKGARHSLKEFQGRYVLLNMWATWCAPCVAELPALAKLKVAAPNITLVAMDLTGRKETPAKAQAFLKEHHAEALGTTVDTDIVFMRTFTAAVMPTTVLIDPKGRVIARAEGPAEWASPAFVAYFKNLK